MNVFYKVECYDAGLKKVDTMIAADTPHELEVDAIIKKIDSISEWKLYDNVRIVRPADKLVLADRRLHAWRYNIEVSRYRRIVKESAEA